MNLRQLEQEAIASALGPAHAPKPKPEPSVAEDETAATDETIADPVPANAPADTIEFACVHCKATVVTPKGTAGKKGQCPDCGGIVRIPGGKSKRKRKKAQSVEEKPAKETKEDAPAEQPVVQAANVQQIVEADPIGAPLSIEFICPSCQDIVETPKSSAGKQGKCPHCHTIVPIPMESNVPDDYEYVDDEEDPVPISPVGAAGVDQASAIDDGEGVLQPEAIPGLTPVAQPVIPVAQPATPGLTPVATPVATPGLTPATPGLTPAAPAAPAVTPGLTPLGGGGGGAPGLAPLADAGVPLQPAPAAAPQAPRRVKKGGGANLLPLTMPPAIGTLVVAGGCLAHHIGFFIYLGIQLARAAEYSGFGGPSPTASEFAAKIWVIFIVQILLMIASACLSVVVVLGGVSLLQAKHYKFVFTTSVFLAIGMIGWLMLLDNVYTTESAWSSTWGAIYAAVGAPFGIYSIVILCLPHVRDNFDRR